MPPEKLLGSAFVNYFYYNYNMSRIALKLKEFYKSFYEKSHSRKLPKWTQVFTLDILHCRYGLLIRPRNDYIMELFTAVTVPNKS